MTIDPKRRELFEREAKDYLLRTWHCIEPIMPDQKLEYDAFIAGREAAEIEIEILGIDSEMIAKERRLAWDEVIELKKQLASVREAYMWMWETLKGPDLTIIGILLHEEAAKIARAQGWLPK